MKKTMKLIEDTKTINHIATRVEKEITGPKAVEATKTKDNIKKFEEKLKEVNSKLKQ
jgi:ABC-type Zn2+ transport system substrate-binding protein/surface adhesin